MRAISHTRRRRGSVYILIIGVSMLAATITVAATLVARTQARAMEGTGNAADARAYAQAAVDMGRLYIAQNSNWRTLKTNGSVFSGMLVGNGSMSLDVTNPNGALNRFDADPVILTGTGSCGTSVQAIKATLTPVIKPYSCLSTALTVNGVIHFNNVYIATSGVSIGSNTSIPDAPPCNVMADVYSTGTIGKGSYYGAKLPNVPAVRLPSASTVLAYYTANGTAITLGDVALNSINYEVLTPGVNTVGPGGTNTNGIYVIDCRNHDATVSYSRFCATVVFINCNNLNIGPCVHWGPAVSTLPALLTDGNINFRLKSNSLSELSTLTNFNPTYAPYPWPTGTSDALLTNTYTCQLKGLIYATGNIHFQEDSTVGMVMCGGKADFDGRTISFVYDSTYPNNPPPGFYDVDMSTNSSSYTQVTY